MQFLTTIVASAALLGSALAAPAVPSPQAIKYAFEGRNWSYAPGRSSEYSVTVKAIEHGDIPRFKAVCTGTNGQSSAAPCTVQYNGPSSGEGSLTVSADMQYVAGASDSVSTKAKLVSKLASSSLILVVQTTKVPKLTVTVFYDNGITCGETWVGSYTGTGSETSFKIYPSEDDSC